MQSKKLKVLAAAVVLAMPLAASAESQLTTGSGTPLTAQARVDIRVVIDKFVFLRVGAGASFANNSTVNELVFTPALADIGNGTPVTGTGGDVTGSTVTVEVRGNNGPIALGATGPAALTSGTDTIPWSQITVDAAGTAPIAPAIGSSVTVGAGKVVLASGTWAYQYANSVTPASGEYTGQITYTATMP